MGMPLCSSTMSRPPRTSDDPRDRVAGVPGLRNSREAGGIRLYRSGMAAVILLSECNPRWWERIADRRKDLYDPLPRQAHWTAAEQAAHAAAPQRRGRRAETGEEGQAAGPGAAGVGEVEGSLIGGGGQGGGRPGRRAASPSAPRAGTPRRDLWSGWRRIAWT
ncbi:hypothetical protein ACFVZA_31645 [Streptomyces bottropensis]|uniref:hypothetical protein n=1 Tax=Streptomyces bottropensis TaxID=42235 RepID=UPI0036B79144